MLYPPIEPYRHGMLDTGDGHQVYWELCGNPDGKPAVFLHGGPGSGSSPLHRQLFDPAPVQRAAVRPARLRPLDARMPAWRTTPPGTWSPTSNACAPRSWARTRWLVFGGSWGSTLALAYAQNAPGSRRRADRCAGSSACAAPKLRWYLPARRVGALSRLLWEDYLAPDPAGRAGRPGRRPITAA